MGGGYGAPAQHRLLALNRMSSLYTWQMTLSGDLFLGLWLSPSSASFSGVGEACGHEVNEARHFAYVDILDVGEDVGEDVGKDVGEDVGENVDKDIGADVGEYFGNVGVEGFW